MKKDLSVDWLEFQDTNYILGTLSISSDEEILLLYEKVISVNKVFFEVYDTHGNKKITWSLEDVNGSQKARQSMKTIDNGYAVLADVEFDGMNRAVFIKLNENGEIIN